jgi:hypothetical protein
VIDQRRGGGLFEQFDQLPIARARQDADWQMAQRPLEPVRAAAKHGIENRRRGARDEQARKWRVDFARPMRQSERDQSMRGRLSVNSAE